MTDPNENKIEEISAPEMASAPLAGSLHEAAKLPLSVELGRLVVDLKTLGELKPEQVLSLKKKVTEPVDLVLSGKSIGKGELLEVEGKLGVKILSIVS